MILLKLSLLFSFALIRFGFSLPVISVEMSGNFVVFTAPFLVLNSGETRIKCDDDPGSSPLWVDPNRSPVIVLTTPSPSYRVFVTTNTSEGSSILTFRDNGISSDMEGTYDCSVGTTRTMLPIFVMTPFLDPITFTPPGPSAMISLGAGISTITCATTGYPAPTITLNDTQNRIATQMSTSPLTLDLTTITPSVYSLVCYAENSYTQTTSTLQLTLLPRTEILLTPVQFLTAPSNNQFISTADTGSPSYAIRVGSAFNLSCPFTAAQLPDPIIWTFPLPSGMTSSSNSDILISSLTIEHAGTYTCGYQSQNVTLLLIPTSYRVLFQRESQSTMVVPERVYLISQLETVSFLCIGSNSTDLATEGWFYPPNIMSGVRITGEYSGVSSNNSESTVSYRLIFNRASTNLTGNYSCMVRDENGVLNEVKVNVNITAMAILPTTTPPTTPTISLNNTDSVINNATVSNPVTIPMNTSIPGNMTNSTVNPSPVVSGLTSTQLALTIAVIIIFLAVLAMAVTVCVCCFFGFRVLRRNEVKSKSEEELQPHEMSVYTQPINRNQFNGTYRKFSSEGNLGFSEQFKKLPTDPEKPTETATLKDNVEMNRDGSVLPFDESRVVLSPDDMGSDYINASFINGAFIANRYIAAQAPLEDFVDHFWRMIWENDVRVIVMLTKLSERGCNMCHQYWPSSRPTQTYGLIIVDILEVVELRHCIIQTFKIKRMFEGRSHVVKHFQFLSWPENSVPEFPTSVITFTKRIRNYVKENRIDSPILVHCNLGIGRTGAWIAIDFLWDKLEWDNSSIDIHACCSLLNVQRKKLIQHITQYMFIHKTMKELMETGNTEFDMEVFQQKFQEKIMSVHNNENLLVREFKLLDIDYNSDQFRSGQDPENRSKNRYSECIPIEEHRVILPKKSGDIYSDYINASYIDGHVRTLQFIVTQSPSKANLEDFWKMVLLTRSEVMVMFPSPTKGASSRRGSIYYPSLRSEESVGIYTINTLLENLCDGFHYRVIGVKNRQDNTYLNLHHFQFMGLPSHCADLVAGYQAMHRMLHSVREKSYEVTKGGPITVHCSSGCGWSAVFVSLFILFERLEKDSCIDVFQTVKSLRLQRPLMVQTLEQYEYIHRAVLEKFYPTLAHY